jgi:acetyl esterase/lipase
MPIMKILLNLLLASNLLHAEPAYQASVPKPTHSEVSYGPDARNVLDFWEAKSEKPASLVLVIHGGAWKAFSKERIHRFVDVRTLLDAGISVAAINYRFIPEDPAEGANPPVKAPMHDSARALQFLRSKATEWHIDGTRIAAVGGSAGACTSLWLAYHDDLADPESDDPVSRLSTRLYCAAALNAQTTLDPQLVKEWIPNSHYGAHAFGKEDFSQILAERDKILPWINEYSPYSLASKDDPPVALFYPRPPAMGEKQSDPTHSPNHGLGLQQLCRNLGIECLLIYPGSADAKFKNATEYLIHMLGSPTVNQAE